MSHRQWRLRFAAATVLLVSALAVAVPITVTAPTETDTLNLGILDTIVWTNDTANPATYVNVQLYRGTEYDRTIATSAVNSGSRNWTVPLDLDTSVAYRMKVMWSTNPSIFGYSSSFRIKDASAVVVTAPDSGSTLAASSSTYLQWRTEGAAGYYVNLGLYSNDQLVQTIYTSASGTSYSWVVPTGLDTTRTYRIRATSTARSTVYGESGPFRIVDRWYVKVLSPTANDTAVHNASRAVTWQITNSSSQYVRIELLRNGAFLQTLTSSAYGSSYSWLVSSSMPTGGGYAIRIASTAFPARADTSQTFNIAPRPWIAVSAPDSFAYLTYGDSVSIGWSSDPRSGAAVKVDLYRDGYFDRAIAASTLNNGSLSWIVTPAIPVGTNFKIRVSNLSSTVYGESGRLSIGPPASKVVTSPDSTTAVRGNQALPISWQYGWFSATYVDIYLYREDTYVQQVTVSTSNDGSHIWTVPASLPTSSRYRIRVINPTAPSIYASSAFFSINNTPQLMLVAPTDGQMFEQGATVTVSWAGASVSGFQRLSYSPNGGQSWVTIDSLCPVQGTRNWVVPGRDTITPCLLRISNPTVPAAADTVSLIIGVRPVLLHPEGPTSERRPQFVWRAVKSQETYQLAIDTNQTFAKPIITVQVGDTAHTPSADLPARTLYWKVTASSLQTLPSATKILRIQDARVPIPIPVSDPTRLRRPRFSWHRVADATTYGLVIGNQADFADVLLSVPVTDTFYVPTTDLPRGTIYWRVQSDLVNEYCETQNFTIQSDTIPYPRAFNGATTGVLPEFSWFSVKNVTFYRFELYDTLGKTTSRALMQLNVQDTVFVPFSPLAPGKYYWRVSCDRNLLLFSAFDSLRVRSTIGVLDRSTLPKNPGMYARANGGRLRIDYAAAKVCGVSLAVYSAGGRRVAGMQRTAAPGYFQWSPGALRLAPGAYLITARIGDWRMAYRLSSAP